MPNSNDIGNRHENQAVDIATRAFGAGVEKVNGWGNSDPWHFADIICLKPEFPVTIIQVKTGQTDPTDYNKYISLRLPETARFEVWERFRRDGWRTNVVRLSDELTWDTYWETDTCNPDKVREEWEEAFRADLQR